MNHSGLWSRVDNHGPSTEPQFHFMDLQIAEMHATNCNAIGCDFRVPSKKIVFPCCIGRATHKSNFGLNICLLVLFLKLAFH